MFLFEFNKIYTLLLCSIIFHFTLEFVLFYALCYKCVEI